MGHSFPALQLTATLPLSSIGLTKHGQLEPTGEPNYQGVKTLHVSQESEVKIVYHI